MKKVLLLLALVLGGGFNTGHFHEHSHELCRGFLPPNDMRIPVGTKNLKGMDEARFNQVLDDVERVYAPIVSQKGGRLVLRRLWSNPEVNARANRQGRDYIVEMFGGLARHPATTADALYLVACHEIGHHIGGVPKYSDSGGQWASVEGQSDYFATLKCMRKIFANHNNQVNSPDPVAVRECDQSFTNAQDRQICVRTAMAGIASANIFKSLDPRSPNLSLSTKDPSRVGRTFESHPQPQCRLDTYFSGGICTASLGTDVSNSNPNQGVCARANNLERGSRPLCWYKPGGGGGTPPPSQDIAKAPTLNGRDTFQSNDPRRAININFDVSEFAGAYGVYVELSLPNVAFSNPNSHRPDPRAKGASIARTRGGIQLIPARDLPGWGRYQIRIFPLDRSGRSAVGRSSNPATLVLQR